ncbi:GGDEF domain-containing protein [Alteromonas mediterranea]|jgi:diguanylate cyclase (GGDEF)-like protein|uniref:diguanylate cyclase n=2 Tax=Alteromonas mediterranea TaxID=314275 RepID=A0AAC8XJ09_9ALTE|nr:diguanylate cyclase [Alteromonas mediterranea]MBR9896938.1 diguanylate cyclase [Gammaproteobacteria bacterium]MEA3382006.1 diguanylate cyclase [Pseudomonadota bacterium]AEA97844.1 diguanylate cyclase [Alteromonas mediterranea DE]AFV85294.1 GGDEF domain protein [Alteromonas mediterranea DE1]AGP81603.1 diguanylate cyclase [Alteromonas mediterranea MED64]|tara:strand:- start:66 stop:977 length:912 start_codon:yes stop_codon:yes gene_type:complete
MFSFTNTTQFRHHTWWLAFTVSIVAIAISLALFLGNPKQSADISGLDIVGEGSIVLLTLAWILAALASRPPGKVTSLLVFGLGFFLFSATLDFLDEFLRYPDDAHWISMIESYPAAVGMVVMTAALYQWHLEQRALNLQLRRREWDYRDHDKIDPITQLYRAEYWKEQIQKLQQFNKSAVLAIIDINNFSLFNQQYGYTEGDRYLHEIAQLLVMNLRQHDLACRYAGDRFAILLPDVSPTQADIIIDEIKASIQHLAFRHQLNTNAIYTSARSTHVTLLPNQTLSTVLNAMLTELERPQKSAA